MSLLDRVHGGYVHSRRVRVLADHLAPMLPEKARVLDVGCGDGWLAKTIQDRRPDLEILGVDVLARPNTRIPVQPFDGVKLPYPDGAFDAVMFVDVLHHTGDPMVLLREAARVARRCLVLKDHTLKGILAGPTLRFMDWVGNHRHGVALPYNYWTERRWREAFAELKGTIEVWVPDLHLYPVPARWFFDRSLHFVARIALHS